MAKLQSYECKKCGWSINVPKEGKDLLMFGRMFYYKCKDCNHVYRCTFQYGQKEEMNKNCPKCDSANIIDWKPADKCPKCGGELVDTGFTVLMN